MDIRELRSFVLLAEQLHFGRTAQLLHVSQPALTKQIHRLEEELGSPLFARHKNGTQLSVFGEQFLPDAREALRHFDHLQEHSRRAAKGEIGKLNLGFGFHTFELVPRLILQLRTTAPGIEIGLRDMSTAEQVADLRDGRIDLGFIRLPAPKNFQVLPVVKDRLALVTPAKSEFPDDMSLKDCRKLPFVTVSGKRSPGFYNHTLQLCAKHGFHPNIVQEAPEITTTLALVRAGLGVSIIPESFRTSHFSGVRLHYLADPAAVWSVGAAWRKDNTNPALLRFLHLLRAEVQK